MNRRATVLAFLLVLLALQLSGSPGSGQALQREPTRSTVLPPGAREAIAAANNAWVAAMHRLDAPAIVEPYADDAVFVTAGGEAVRGRASIERLMRERFTKTGPAEDVALQQDGVSVAGAMIYEWGHASYKTMVGGRPVTAAGRYLTVWKQDGAGRWRIIRNLSLAE